MACKVKELQEFLDSCQYSINGIKRYQWIFGNGYISTGGLETTQEIVPLLKLKPLHKVLDVGCGIGGHDFFMAEKYGAIIEAVDLSTNMLSVAQSAYSKMPHIDHQIYFRMCDITQTLFEPQSFDAIYSRDAIMHIENKDQLFECFFKWLKPGGKIVFTDYCRGSTTEFSDEFESYVKERNYYLMTIPKYEELLKKVGFSNVSVQDWHKQFIESLTRELSKLSEGKQDFLQHFTAEDYAFLEEGWLAKIERVKKNEQTWALCCAEKPIGQ